MERERAFALLDKAPVMQYFLMSTPIPVHSINRIVP
jgi:hypothetical protein